MTFLLTASLKNFLRGWLMVHTNIYAPPSWFVVSIIFSFRLFYPLTRQPWNIKKTKNSRFIISNLSRKILKNSWLFLSGSRLTVNTYRRFINNSHWIINNNLWKFEKLWKSFEKVVISFKFWNSLYKIRWFNLAEQRYLNLCY